MNNFLTTLFSLTGILFGMVLSLISPEEMLPGKRYFILLRRSLFVIISLFIIFNLLENIYFLSLFLVVFIVLFILDIKFSRKIFYLVHYLFFILPYFFISKNFQLVLASLVFLYGFPVGTLLRVDHEKEKRS